MENCVPYANPACKYQVTWHATHCCGACARGKKHGPRCECKEVPQVEPETKTKEAAAKGEEVAIAEVTKEEAVALESRAEAVTKEDSDADSALDMEEYVD